MYQKFSKTVYASNQKQIPNESLEITENSNEIDIYQIIQKNTENKTNEEIITEEIELEYTTTYKNNDELAKGAIQVLQEGRNGVQKVTIKNIYENGNLISTEQLDAKIIKSSITKIVEVGTSNIASLKIIVGDITYVSPTTVSVRIEPNTDSEKLITLNQNDEIKILQIQGEWCKISHQNYVGWIEKNCIKTNKPIEETKTEAGTYTKQQLLSRLSENMNLNKQSGLSLEQFKKVLSKDTNDKNKVFENNAQYFYYAEKQYNVNGVFVAAIGIHESAWGTSKIALNKKNLFGYGAYDNSAYSSSYNFNSYSEGIDLISRVLTKYYLNKPGTKIYDGETASGKYYNGSTLAGVNKRYATDTNWAKGVYKWMSYLYNKL